MSYDAGDGPVSVWGYPSTRYFPIPDRYVVVVDKYLRKWYVPLDLVGAEYDSGLRVRVAEDGLDYQVCTCRLFNVLNVRLTRANAFINVRSLDYVALALGKVFGPSRVKVTGSTVTLRVPSVDAGVTRLLLVGLNASVTTDDGVTISTLKNGWNISSFYGDAQRHARAVVVELTPRRVLTFAFDDDYAYADPTLPVHNCLILGRVLEAVLPEAGLLSPFYESDSWCTYDEVTGAMVDYTADPASVAELECFKERLVKYKGGDRGFNYVNLNAARYLTPETIKEVE